MASDEFTKQDTAPVVDGGVYTRTRPDGRIETGQVRGTMTYADGKVEGWFYGYTMGNVPYKFVEGTATMQGWELIAAPSQQAGKTLAGQHKAKLAALAAAKEEIAA